MNERNADQVWSNFTDENSAEALEIHAKLRFHVESQVGPSNRLPIVLAVKSREGKLLGGLRGYSHWQWLYVSHLYVDESSRSTGLGGELMRRVELEARDRSCVGLYVDTFDEKARDFYGRNGFSMVGEIANFPPGKTRFYLSKKLKE